MLRERAQSHLTHSKHHGKEHCPEDLSCRKCCACVDVLKKQNKILTDKNAGWNKEKKELENYIAKLLKQLKEWQRKKKQFQDMQQFKKKLREEVKKDLMKQLNKDFMILQDKYDNAKLAKDKLKQQNDLLKQQLAKKDKKIKQLEDKLKKLQPQNDKKPKKKDESDDDRLAVLEEALKNKSDLIARLEKALKIAQNNYIEQRGKYASLQFQNLQNLQKINELKLTNQQKAQACKNLESAIFSYKMLENQLKNRIAASENYAYQKEVQAKLIQTDYYNSLNRRNL